MMKNCGGMCGLHKLAALLLVIGGLNWGLVAIDPSYDLVAWIFGGSMMLGARVVYGLVGLSALMMIAAMKCCMGCKKCMDGKCDMHMK